MSTKQYIVTRSIVTNSRFAKSILPYLKDEYFQGNDYKLIFETIRDHVHKYNSIPDFDAIVARAEDDPNISEDDGNSLLSLLADLKQNPLLIDNTNEQWALDNAEMWCKERATRIALEEGIKIQSGKSDKKTESILELMKCAASISFDRRLGHDYLKDYDKRYDFYHTVLDRVPTGVNILDMITGGGFPKKTLNVLQAGTNVGKTLFKSSIAGNVLKGGRNVLYITLEDGEEKIGKRIDAHLLDVTMEQLEGLSKREYFAKMERLNKVQGIGRLVIREYPGTSISVMHLNNLMQDLYLQEDFVPDLVCIDYLNLVLSSRVKAGNNASMYSVIKCVAEELRGFAQIHNVALLTSTQTNRSGFTKTVLGLEDSSESFGVPMTADWFISIVTDEELDKQNLWACFHNKSRYADKSKHPKFFLSVNRDKQAVTDTDPVFQEDDVVSSIPDIDFGDGGDHTLWD